MLCQRRCWWAVKRPLNFVVPSSVCDISFIHSFVHSFIHLPHCQPKINNNFSLRVKCQVQLLETRFKPIMSFSIMDISGHHCIFFHQIISHQEFFCEVKLLASSSYHDTDERNKKNKKRAAALISKTRTLNALHTFWQTSLTPSSLDLHCQT